MVVRIECLKKTGELKLTVDGKVTSLPHRGSALVIRPSTKAAVEVDNAEDNQGGAA